MLDRENMTSWTILIKKCMKWALKVVRNNDRKLGTVWHKGLFGKKKRHMGNQMHMYTVRKTKLVFVNIKSDYSL